METSTRPQNIEIEMKRTNIPRPLKQKKESAVFENFLPDYSQPVHDDYSHKMINTWKREQKFFDYRVTKFLNDIEIAVLEEAQSFLNANDFFMNNNEKMEDEDKVNFNDLWLTPVCEYISEPSATAFIREITVHFRDIANPNLSSDEKGIQNVIVKHADLSVIGFIFKFSDGVEKEIGNLRGSTLSASVSLLENEYVIHVAQTLWKDISPPFRSPSLSSIGVRKVFIGIRNHKGAERVVYFEDGQVMETRWSGGSDCMVIKEGEILRSLKWSAEELKILGVITQSKPGQSSRSMFVEEMTSSTVPSLQELAKKALPKPSQYVEKLRDQQSDIIRTTVNAIVISAQGMLLKKFLEKERRIDLLDEVKCSLETAAEQDVVRDLEKQKARILTICDVDCINLSWAKSDIMSYIREEVHLLGAIKKSLQTNEAEDNRAYEQYNAQLQLLQSINHADERMMLCKNVYCLQTFIPSFVRNRRRCSVRGCFETRPNCGCAIKSCKRCHVSFCQRHMMSHEGLCKDTFHSKCGWSSNRTALKPELCGHIIDDTAQRCIVCSTQCCNKCSIPYEGSRANNTISLVEGSANQLIRDELTVVPCKSVLCNACIKYCDPNNPFNNECINSTVLSPNLTFRLNSNQIYPLNSAS